MCRLRPHAVAAPKAQPLSAPLRIVRRTSGDRCREQVIQLAGAAARRGRAVSMSVLAAAQPIHGQALPCIRALGVMRARARQ
jgi:hypothetical protein